MSNSRAHIPKLNCEVGDLAITVNCKLPENLGNIVLIKSAIGMKQLGESEEAMFSWEVEIATEHGWLMYRYEDCAARVKSGPVPDKYLRRITPPKGYLMDEFSESEELQQNLYRQDLFEGHE